VCGQRALLPRVAARSRPRQGLHQPSVRPAAPAVCQRPAHLAVCRLGPGVARAQRAAGRAGAAVAPRLLLAERLAVPAAQPERAALRRPGTRPARLCPAPQAAGEQDVPGHAGLAGPAGRAVRAERPAAGASGRAGRRRPSPAARLLLDQPGRRRSRHFHGARLNIRLHARHHAALRAHAQSGLLPLRSRGACVTR